MKTTFNYAAYFIFIFSLSCSNSKKIIVKKTENNMNAPLQNTYWKLTQPMGQPIKGSGNNNREAYIKFNSDGKNVAGNGGCNNFGGSSQLTGSSHISFGPMISTKMYCKDVPYENLFFDVLSKADNFIIIGNNLAIRNPKMDSTVKFVAENK